MSVKEEFLNKYLVITTIGFSIKIPIKAIIRKRYFNGITIIETKDMIIQYSKFSMPMIFPKTQDSIIPPSLKI